MGVFAKLGFGLGSKKPSVSNVDSKQPSAGYCAKGQAQPEIVTNELASYLVPGSSAVLVSGSPMPKTISSLEPGDKILGTDIMGGNALIWATLDRIEATSVTSRQRQTILIGLGEHDELPLKSEQVVLTRDTKKKKLAMRSVRRLEVGYGGAVVVFNADGLQWRGKKAEEVKQITSIRLVREKEMESAEGFYKLTVGSTKHSLLMSCAPDAKHFVVANSENSTIDFETVAAQQMAAEASEAPKMTIKNTFVEVKLEDDKERCQPIPRSYSDSDLQKLAMELEMGEAQFSQQPIFANDDMLDLSSNRSSALTSKSRASSLFAKSEISSMSGGSIIGIRMGTEFTTDKEGNQESNGTKEISLNSYASLPVNELGVRLSAASVSHTSGRRSKCRKCAFYNTFSMKKGKICKNGALCDFCHEGHDRFIHRR